MFIKLLTSTVLIKLLDPEPDSDPNPNQEQKFRIRFRLKKLGSSWIRVRIRIRIRNTAYGFIKLTCSRLVFSTSGVSSPPTTACTYDTVQPDILSAVACCNFVEGNFSDLLISSDKKKLFFVVSYLFLCPLSS